MNIARKELVKKLNTSSASGSLNRSVLLLQTISQGSLAGTSLKDLVARTKLPRPTIHRVLDMLIDIGWVIRAPDTKRFNLGVDLAILGYSAISRNPIEKVANTYLSILANELGQIVYLNVRSQLDSICIGKYESQSQVQAGRGYVGMRIPFGLSPAGMAMLIKLPKKEIDMVVSANISSFYKMDGFDEVAYRIALEKALHNGYVNYEGFLFDKTISGLGVPILDNHGYPIAGIGSTYLNGRLNDSQKQTSIKKLFTAAGNIAKDLLLQKDQ